MNVLIVESEKKEEIKLTRMLRQADPAINIINRLNDIEALIHWLEANPSPDLVLVNVKKLPPLGMQQVYARLVLHTPHYNLSYLAFRTPMLQGLKENFTGVPGKRPASLPGTAAHFLQPVPEYNRLHAVFKSRFFVEQGQKFLSIPVEDIAYFFSDERLVLFYTFSRNKYVIHYRIEELEQLLDPSLFYRINRSYIISIRSIDQISGYFGGRFKLRLVPPAPEEILVSRKRAADFKIWLGD